VAAGERPVPAAAAIHLRDATDRTGREQPQVNGGFRASQMLVRAMFATRSPSTTEDSHNNSDAWTQSRRRYHHLTFYGFMLCCASTCVATLYHYGFGWPAPYGYTSAPVVLGTLGGIGLVIGPVGLWRQQARRHPLHGDSAQRPMDRAFIAVLLATGATGLVLLVGRDTGAMALLLSLHLGCVMALFLTLPYSKFAHGVFRTAALLKWAVEKRLPSRLRLGSE
jgi:citrate/tricarballylate utilization protein